MIDALPARPYAATFCESFFDHLQNSMRLELLDDAGSTLSIQGDDRFELSVVADSWTPSAPHRCRLKLKAGDANLGVQYDAQADEPYSLEPGQTWQRCIVKVPEMGRFTDCDLAEYFSEFTPTLFLTDGSAVFGRQVYLCRPPDQTLPKELCMTAKWSEVDCDITVEDGQAPGDKCSVLDATAKLLPKLLAQGTVVFYDHHSGEIADYVAFEPESDRLRVHLIHCKASSKEKAGARQKDAFEVLGQARKSVRWMHKRDLFDIVRTRMVSAPDRMLHGSLEDFDRLVSTQTPQIAAYTVHVVQPGFDMSKIQKRRDKSIRLMILSLYDELASQEGVAFRITGS